MRKLLITLCVTVVSCLSVKAELKAGGEYYIWLNIYEKLLGTNEAGNGPALSAYGTKSDGYVFVAEESGESGYFLLKQKSSGKYLAASGSNDWSIVFEDSRSTDTRFRWKMTGPDSYAYLTNKKNSSSYVGIDGAKKGADYVSIYYDKPKGSHGQFSVIPAEGAWDEARQVYESAVYTNAQGVQEIDYCQLKDKEIDRSDAVDIHITANDNPMLGNSKVNLGSDRTWLVIDNIVPSDVIKNYLEYVTIKGAPAKNGENCRVAIYLNGAAVIPLPDVAMSCDGTEGAFELTVGNHKDLSTENQNNTMTSFVLRRGYMATLACGSNGQWYSRVFVADHSDLEVTLPNPLAKRVSSVNIKPWQYLSKKGWGDTGGASRGPELRATWFWSWSAGYNSTSDMEYVPCRQHRYWPSTDEVNNKTATASLSLNEPEHAEQHTSDKCSCGGVTNAWTAYKDYNSTFQAGGGRIGSPQPTDFSYLKTYFTEYVDKNDNHSRCDFAVTHAYWDKSGRSATSYADYFVRQCKSIYDNTNHRPVWLTELEIGASWGEDWSGSMGDYAQYIQVLLQKIDECDYIERYAIYTHDSNWKTHVFYDLETEDGKRYPNKGWISPVGEIYRDHRATFAYNAETATKKIPVWWADGVKTPTLDYSVNLEEQTITFTVGNGNTDATDQLTIEYQQQGSGSWQTLISLSDDRNLLESDKLTKTVNLSDLNVEGGKFRVNVTTLYGGSATSSEVTAPVVSDLQSLLPLIAAAEEYPLGFSRGEYAPYTNAAVLQALAVAKEMKPYVTGFQEACQTLANAVWIPNEVELDAVYDGTFAHAPNNGAPAGWSMSNNSLGGDYHSRAFVGDSRLSEFNDTKSGFFIRFDGTNSNRGSLYYYGRTEGYTMPLKEGGKYRLTVDATGWNSTDKPLVLRVTGPSGFTAVDQQIKTESKAETENKKPQQFVIDFTANVAGNYEFYFQCPGSDDNKHIAIVSNISLRRVVEKGDVDGSGVIDINDVKALVSSILGDKPVGFFDKAADLNGDENVDISDVTKLIEKVLSPN